MPNARPRESVRNSQTTGNLTERQRRGGAETDMQLVRLLIVCPRQYLEEVSKSLGAKIAISGFVRVKCGESV